MRPPDPDRDAAGLLEDAASYDPREGSDRLIDELAAWARDAQVGETVDQRRRERWLRRQAEEEATFAGVLVDLAEGGEPVAVATCAGRVHRGAVSAVGDDFVLLEPGVGQQILLRHSSVAWVRQDRAGRPPRGDRPLALTMTFEEALRGTLEPGERVQVVVSALPDPLNGDVLAVGLDVLTLQPADGCRLHLPLARIDEVHLAPRR